MTSQKEANSIQDIPSMLKHWAEVVPEKEAFVFFNETGRTTVLTAKDVHVLAGRFATRLREMGFKKGDLIANAVPNSPERVVADFGIIMTGCIGANCQIMENDGTDFYKTANRAMATGIILPFIKTNPAFNVLQRFLPSNYPSTGYIDVAIPEVPSMKRIILIDRSNNNNNNNNTQDMLPFLDSLRQSSDEVFPPQDVSPDSVVYVFGTSGTTGFSKLCPRDHRTILATGRIYSTGKPSRRFSTRPLGWVGGFPFQYLADSSCNVIQDCFNEEPVLDAKQLWDVVESEECTAGFMLPGEIDSFLVHFKDDPPKHRLKVMIVGGQPLTKRVCNALGVLADCLVLTYASTEMSGVTNGIVTSPDQMEDYLTGKPLLGVALKIVDENMQQVDTGKEGIIVVKSPFGSNHYYNQSPGDKPTTTADGYFITGDRGWVNQDGDLFVSDRNDDVIFHGSILVYPSWPESVLIRISGVSEAVVMGVSGLNSNGVNDQICACVIPKHGSNLTRDNIISSYNNSFAVTENEFFPKLSFVELFSEFPMGHTGKVNRKKLRKILMDRISL